MVCVLIGLWEKNLSTLIEAEIKRAEAGCVGKNKI